MKRKRSERVWVFGPSIIHCVARRNHINNAGAPAEITREDPVALCLIQAMSPPRRAGERKRELSYLEPISQLQRAYRYSELNIALRAKLTYPSSPSRSRGPLNIPLARSLSTFGEFRYTLRRYRPCIGLPATETSISEVSERELEAHAPIARNKSSLSRDACTFVENSLIYLKRENIL